MDGYTAVTVSFLGFLFVVGVLVAMALLMARQPGAQQHTHVWQQPAQLETIERGTAWAPSESQLCGSWQDACVLADPNLPVGELRAAWLDYHDGMGHVTVEQPKRTAVRQIGTSIRPLVRYE